MMKKGYVIFSLNLLTLLRIMTMPWEIQNFLYIHISLCIEFAYGLVMLTYTQRIN